MRDNLSIVILMILLVLVMIMFPLYNYFERQDDMSYNLALKATTNFVDQVLNSGYIDQDMYDRLVTQLSNTGNLYDIQLEAHKKILVEDLDNEGTYIEKSMIDYNDDIFEEISGTQTNINEKTLKNNVYNLNQGDEFYIKLKNSTTTMAGAIFNSIITTSSKDRIVVNYGGVIKNNSWAKVDATYNAKEYYSDDISYIEYKFEGNGFRKVIYFNDIPNGGYAVNFSIINGRAGSGYTLYKNDGNIKNAALKDAVIEITDSAVLVISGDSDLKISITNQDTKKAANLVEYKIEYADKDNLICNYEKDYNIGKYWPNIVAKYSGVLAERAFNNSDKIYDTKCKFDYSEEAQEKGYTLEAVFTISSTDLVNANNNKIATIVGDIMYPLGGIGIEYGKVNENSVLKGNLFLKEKQQSSSIFYNYGAINQRIKSSMTVKYDKEHDSTKVNLYFNGARVSSGSFPGKLKEHEVSNIFLSADSWDVGISNQFYGSIDSVQIYNKALTDEQIQSNWQISNSKYIF